MNDDLPSDDSAHPVRRLVDHVPSMLGYWDADLRCRFANRAYERWFGTTPGGLVGTDLKDMLGPQLFARNEPHIRAARGGEEQMFERQMPGPDGTLRHIVVHYLPDIVDGQVVGFMVEVTDVSHLKATEAALRAEVAERERALALLRHSETVLREAQRLGQIGSWEWVIDTDHAIWSDQLYAIFGYDPSQPPPSAAEQESSGLFKPGSLSAMRVAIQHAMETEQPFAVEAEYQRRDGVRGWIEARGEAVRDAAGKPVKLRGTVHEITVRRQMQDARLQRDVAEAASRNKTQFLSRVSHELRTPLNAILGFAQLCEIDNSLNGKLREWVAHIRTSGEHMLGLIDEILDLSGAELGQMRMTCVEMDLVEMARNCLIQLSHMASAAELTLTDELPPTALRVVADPRRVRQVLTNLLSNAIKYSRTGSVVRVSAAARGPWVELRVEDAGVGMDASQLQRLFTPFDRLGAEGTPVPGSGIGLALSRKLVELMGGEIEVQSEPGAGSVFTILLPTPATAASPSARPQSGA
ncbi:MAG: ATP-binding protein [Rhizobacter sp.]